MPQLKFHDFFASQLTLHRYDLEDTFQVVVGEHTSGVPKTFTLHTQVFAERSPFLAVARKREETAQDRMRPGYLKLKDPELFKIYINCVYFGQNFINQYGDAHQLSFSRNDLDSERAYEAADVVFDKLTSLCLLAIEMRDYKTANMVIDEIIRFSDLSMSYPRRNSIELVYAYNAEDRQPLRLLMRDFWIYECYGRDIELIRDEDYHADFVRDVAISLLDIRVLRECTEKFDVDRRVMKNCSEDPCYYHVHDEMHPRCAPEPFEEIVPHR